MLRATRSADSTSLPGQGAGNVISGNRSSGVIIVGSAASGNQVQGNLIGTDGTGSLPCPTRQPVSPSTARATT